MKDELIDLKLATTALDRAGGDAFEKFVNAFYPSIAGEDFVPLGGLHDGGADSFQDCGVFTGNSTKAFYQASREEDHRAKITKTVKRLRDFGRSPELFFFITSRVVPYIDQEETHLSRKLDVAVRIRDRTFITAHINDTPSTRAAFFSYLDQEVSFLKNVGGADVFEPSATAPANSPAVFVFLRQEIDRRGGKDGLVNALADGLILWALEGTDPEKNEFMTEMEVSKRIEEVLPPAGKMLRGVIPKRLRALGTIPKGEGRSIRWHKKRGAFCLSFDLRKELKVRNAEEEALSRSRSAMVLFTESEEQLQVIWSQKSFILVQIFH